MPVVVMEGDWGQILGISILGFCPEFNQFCSLFSSPFPFPFLQPYLTVHFLRCVERMMKGWLCAIHKQPWAWYSRFAVREARQEIRQDFPHVPYPVLSFTLSLPIPPMMFSYLPQYLSFISYVPTSAPSLSVNFFCHSKSRHCNLCHILGKIYINLDPGTYPSPLLYPSHQTI